MNPFSKPEPRESDASGNALGTTMRIDLSPEALEEARKVKKRKTRQIFPVPKPRAVAPTGGVEFQQLLQNIYDAAVITDLAGQIVITNVRANQFFLSEPGHFIGESILTLICGAEDALLPTILETLQANRFVLMQAYCQRTDGSFFAAEISVNLLRLSNTDHLSFFVRDVSVRKEQEERLRTGYTALQNSSSGIVIAARDGSLEYWNPAFLSLFGLTEAHQIEGHDLREFLCEPHSADDLFSTTEAGYTWSGELEMKRLNASTFFGQVSAAPNVNTDGEQVGIVLSVLDITLQKLAQRQLQKYAAELHARNTEFQEDLNIASELHHAFLPREFMVFPANSAPGTAQLQIRNLYSPSGTIGGDFVDVRAISDHEVAFFISDVMGHGIRSALVVSTIRGLIEQLRPLANDPGALLTQLNATYTTMFKQLGGSVLFCTALYGIIDTQTGVMRCANASHPRPYVLHRDSSTCERLSFATAGRSTALGILPEARYSTVEFKLSPKDLLLLYTDGLSEAGNAKDELYDGGRFQATLQSMINQPISQLVDGLLEDAKKFSERDDFDDDVCLLAIELLSLRNAGGQTTA